LTRVVRNFKVEFFGFKKKLVEGWKIPTVDSASLLIICNLQIFTFLESLTKLPCFIDGRDFEIDRRHAYQVDEKKLFDFNLGLKKMNGLKITQFSQKYFVTIFKHMHTIKLGMLELLDLHLMLPKLLPKKL
jgi:hypothetical protein